MHRSIKDITVLGMALCAFVLKAQNAAPPPAPTQGGGDYYSAAWMQEHVPELIKQSLAGNGSATLLIHRYPGNYMNLMVRTKTGVGEMHANWTDILVAIDGEANIITGGTLVDRTDGRDGESRGTRSEGGTDHIMHKGDVLHIMPGTAHWTVLQPGKTFTFWAVKIETRPPTP